jgi:nucleoside-diphosphate-sugar epimerase
MRIAVTGANGFIGQSLCLFLQQQLSANLITLTRNPSVISDTQLGFSATDDDLIRSLRATDCFIHLAARAHSNHSTVEDFERDKVNGNSTNGRAPFSADELPRPEDIYGESKLASEQTLKRCLANTNTQLVIIRPPLVYGDKNKGNLQSLEKLIHTGIPIPFGKSNNLRDLVSIENLCTLITLAITHPNAANETFLVSDGVARSTKEIVQLLAMRQNKPAKFFNLPNWIFSVAEKLKPQLIERLTGDLQVDIAKTRSLLGWNPHN